MPKNPLAWLKEKITSEDQRYKAGWDQLKQDAGLIYMIQMHDVEQRRTELKKALASIIKQGLTWQKMEAVVDQAYASFLIIGMAWFRGLDDETLAGKVSDFMDNYRDVRNIQSTVPYLFEEAMFMVNCSWTEKDVTTSPPTIIATTPYIFAKGGGHTPETQIDPMAIQQLQREVEELRKKQK